MFSPNRVECISWCKVSCDKASFQLFLSATCLFQLWVVKLMPHPIFFFFPSEHYKMFLFNAFTWEELTVGCGEDSNNSIKVKFWTVGKTNPRPGLIKQFLCGQQWVGSAVASEHFLCKDRSRGAEDGCCLLFMEKLVKQICGNGIYASFALEK